MSTVIHPTAIVSKGAVLGEDVNIGPYCIVDGDVKIGDRTVLTAFSRICRFTEVGSDCVFHEHTVIGGNPQDLSFKGEETHVIVGNRVTCREAVTINRAVGEGEVTSVGDGCLIMEGVHLAHNVRVGKGCTIANKSGLSGHVRIGDYAVIGGIAGFHQFVHVGPYCMIGGMSRVVQDVPPYCLAAGSPMFVYDINKIGLRRHGVALSSRSLIRQMYKLIYGSGLTIKDGLAEVGRLYGDTPEGKVILEFAAESIRGFSPRVKLTHRSKEGTVADVKAID